ncbi:hypothetical protein [Actinophytocola oryzae]|uniref:Uncharacterized protein n=1 Tax=Actinophytocola oryzae TaxID=502181 RepID=A0A4R7UUM1_9PSEU|nr:hypothetical protein [Actinophytocola oryzae]TDV36686.1 hypothetical protein CLV71_13166 [Actinophytocola oryzae]
MRTPMSAARVDALAEIYRLERHFDREQPDLLDHALDLALSEQRQDHHLIRNVMRNARWSVLRRAQTRISMAAKYPLADPSHRRRVWRDPEGREQALMVDNRTPESAAIAADFLARLDGEAEQIGQYGPRCLDGLLAGYTARETARIASVSTTTVERSWRHLRRYARENFYPDHR